MAVDVIYCIEKQLVAFPAQRQCPTWNQQCYRLLHLPEETLELL